jgi:hypothetical protein
MSQLTVQRRNARTQNRLSGPTPTIKTIPTTSVTPKKAILEALPISFDFKGFHYRQIARKGLVAIYSQSWKGLKNPSVAYEVVKIQEHPQTEMFGRLVPAHESMPGSEKWGSQGWTFTTEGKARAKFRELTAMTSHP